MIGQRRLYFLWVCLLLVSTLCPYAQSRRGGMSRGFGGGMRSRGMGGGAGAQGMGGMGGRGMGGAGAQGMGGMGARGVGGMAPPVQSQGSSNTGLKVAGAAAAGALGGAMLGHGLSSMGRPGYGYGYGGYPGYGGYGYRGYGGGYSSGGARYEETDEFRNGTEGEYYMDASSPCHASSSTVFLGSMVSFLTGFWIRGI